MRLIKIVLPSAGFLLFMGLLFFYLLETGKNDYDSKLNIKYSFKVQNTTNKPVKDAGLLVSVPYEHTAIQKRIFIDANHPYETIRDDVGNSYLDLTWKLIPPFSTKIITIESQIGILHDPERIEELPVKMFLDPESFIESDAYEIRRQAHALKADGEEETVHRMFNWVADNVQYTGYVKKYRGALYAIEHRKGDCSEFAFLFAALCRAVGVPARCVGGFICPKNMVIDLGEYHNWAEFYLNGRWHLADPQRKVFMNNASHYITFHLCRPGQKDYQGLFPRIIGTGLEVKPNT